jgi:2-(1,2-epoxy-1,2-dihydrophenyl)acetyl-CoA isomerase
VPADELDAAVQELASRLAQGPTQAYAAIRRSVEYSSTHAFPESLAHEAEMMTFTGSTQDHRDAVDAFVAKRKPEFHGR